MFFIGNNHRLIFYFQYFNLINRSIIRIHKQVIEIFYYLWII